MNALIRSIQALDKPQKARLLGYLGGFMTESRNNRIREVLNNRTRHCCLILENVFQSHNISAVMRSCDCFGIQDMHIIDHVNSFKTNPDVDLGASKWINVHTYSKSNAVQDCLGALRDKGYRIIATTPHTDDVVIQDFDVSQKFALAFGTELDGLSAEIMDQSDAFLKIPMVGFTESLNISVSAAISLFYLSTRIRNEVADWHLPEDEFIDLELEWVMSSVRSSGFLAKRFLKEVLGARL